MLFMFTAAASSGKNRRLSDMCEPTNHNKKLLIKAKIGNETDHRMKQEVGEDGTWQLHCAHLTSMGTLGVREQNNPKSAFKQNDSCT